MVKKDHIEAYELMYAVAMKSTSYTDLPTSEPAVFNPFRKTTVHVESGDIFEAEVIRKTEFRGTRRAFKGSAFEWQRNQNPARYGASHCEPVAQENNLLPLRKLS
jgi:hypothetical protein